MIEELMSNLLDNGITKLLLNAELDSALSNTKTLSTLSVKCQEGLLLSLIKISARQAPSRSQRRHEAHEKDFFSMIVLSINSALKLQL